MSPLWTGMQVVKLFMPFFIFFARFQNYGKHFSHQARATPVWKANDANLCYFVPVYLHGYDSKNMIFQLAGVN